MRISDWSSDVCSSDLRVGSRWNKLFQTHRGYRKSQANSSRPADGDRRHRVRHEWHSESARHEYRGKNLPRPRSRRHGASHLEQLDSRSAIDRRWLYADQSKIPWREILAPDGPAALPNKCRLWRELPYQTRHRSRVMA